MFDNIYVGLYSRRLTISHAGYVDRWKQQLGAHLDAAT